MAQHQMYENDTGERLILFFLLFQKISFFVKHNAFENMKLHLYVSCANDLYVLYSAILFLKSRTSFQVVRFAPSPT